MEEHELRNMSQYNGSLTREQFMFREMRIIARLYRAELCVEAITEKIIGENLFQYPMEREIKGKCRVALRRLSYILRSETLVEILAEGSICEAKQAALVAMMCDSRLLAEFMVDVIGGKYRALDMMLEQKDLNLFFAQICEKDEKAATWSTTTVRRIKSVLMNVLRENDYIEGMGGGTLLPVMISEEFESALKELGLQSFLPAFNVLN